MKLGQLVWIESDLGLGPARVIDDSHPQRLEVQVLDGGERRFYARRQAPLARVRLDVGQKLRVAGHHEPLHVTALRLGPDGLYAFETSEGPFLESDVTGLSADFGARELLAQGRFTAPKAFQLRHEALELRRQREIHPLRGAVGCRVEPLAHQLTVLHALLGQERIRALLADEVGLGKTIEAGLLFSALHARKQLKKVLVIVPEPLKVQWLTESFRRFNMRFRLDHEELIEDDEFREFTIASTDELERNQGHFDLLVVDEAHRLGRTHAEALGELVAQAKHVLFLSATPRAEGDEAFANLLRLLGRDGEEWRKPLLFHSRRAELGLPHHRHLQAAFVPDKSKWLHEFLRERLEAKTPEKVFIITTKADEAIRLHAELKRKHGARFALFHEELDLVDRDRQAAYFAEPGGAAVLVSSEIGGEGRNFQFCHDLVLWDLPADPLVVEQRIGRLDRLGQKSRVNVWCPVEEDSDDEGVFAELRDRYRVFDEPWTGTGEAPSATTTELFEAVPFRIEEAALQLQSLAELSDVDIAHFFERLCDLYGVEVEDIDAYGNRRISASSLMFVDYFPGLGPEGSRLLTFDRAQALAREELSYFSADHPDFVEAVDFFLNGELGRTALARLGNGSPSDVLLVGLVRDGSGELLPPRAWSLRRQDLVPLPRDWMDGRSDPASLPEPVLRALPAATDGLLASAGEHAQAEAFLVLLVAAADA
jgi:ATP-dependent helicase HepA